MHLLATRRIVGFRALAVVVLSLTPTAGEGEDGWTPLGPGGAIITALAVDPQNSTTLFAGTSGGNVYKSEDEGDTWTLVSTDIGTTTYSVDAGAGVTTLIIDPDRSHILYAVGKSSTDGSGKRQGVMLKSSDQGRNWTSLRSDSINTVVMDSKIPQVLYAGTDAFVEKSEDGGETWTHVHSGITVRTLAIDPQNSVVVYAGGSSLLSHRGGTLEPLLYRSEDSGGSWQRIGAGFFASAISVLAIAPSQPQTLYAGTALSGVYKSEDSGGSWTLTGHSQGVASLVIDPEQPEILFAGTFESGLYKSVDGGEAWSQVLPDFGVPVLAMSPNQSQTLYAGVYEEGVHRSTDGGSTWLRVNKGLNETHVLSVVIDPQNAQIVHVGTWGRMFRSDDGGESWTQADSSAPAAVARVAIDPRDANAVRGVVFRAGAVQERHRR